MDRTRIDKLLQAFTDLDEEITNGVQIPLAQLSMKMPDYLKNLLALKEDCEVVYQKMEDAQTLLNEVRQKGSRTQNAVNGLYSIYQEIQGRVLPPTVGASIADIVTQYLSHEGEMIRVEDVQKALEDRGVVLAVKNPAAVIASILARDERLEKVEKGLFKKKISEVS
jgi:hypothetical protein